MRKQNEIEAEVEANFLFEENVIGVLRIIPKGLNIYSKLFSYNSATSEGSYLDHSPCLS